MRTSLLIPLALLTSFAAAQASLPAGLRFDDGFTYFECQNFKRYEQNRPISEWVPIANLRVLGKAPDRSGWKVVVKQDGKALAEYTADGFPQRLAGGEEGMVIVGFWRDTPRLTTSGLHAVEIWFLDGATDKEHLARTCELDVRRVERVRGGVGSREPDGPEFFVNRHAEVLSSVLYFRNAHDPSYTGIGGVTTYSDPSVEMLVSYSDNADFQTPREGRVRIEVDGKELSMRIPDHDRPQDRMPSGSVARHYNVEASDRNAERFFSGGPANRERVGFAWHSLSLPLLWGKKPEAPRKPTAVYTQDHPGDWKVTWILDRKPVRIWRFRIDAEGMPVPHAEQEKGLSLAPRAILVETEIPGEGGVFDGRLTNEFVKRGAFFGRPWATEAMQKAAAAVPSKGTPFPVPSELPK